MISDLKPFKVIPLSAKNKHMWKNKNSKIQKFKNQKSKFQKSKNQKSKFQKSKNQKSKFQKTKIQKSKNTKKFPYMGVEANHVIIVKIFVTGVTPLHFFIFIKYPGDLEFFRLVKPHLSRLLFITYIIS